MADIDMDGLVKALGFDPAAQQAELARQLTEYATVLEDGRVELRLQYPFERTVDTGGGGRPETVDTVTFARPKGRHTKMLVKATAATEVDVVEKIMAELGELRPKELTDKMDDNDYQRVLAAYRLFSPAAAKVESP